MIKEIFKKIIAILCVTTCAYAYCKSSLLTAGKCMVPPEIDGNINDQCWKKTIEIGPFVLNRQNSFAAQRTSVWISYDSKNIYFAFKCSEKALIPANNSAHEFKAENRKRDDKKIWSQDDCIVILLNPDMKKTICYEFFINGTGSICDSKCTGPNFWQQRDKTWNPLIKTAVQTENGYWTAEIAVPLNEIDFTPGNSENIGIVLGRIQRSCGETSSWQTTHEGFHTPAALSKLELLSNSIGINYQQIPAFKLGHNSLKLKLHPDNSRKTIKIVHRLQLAGKKTFVSWEDFNIPSKGEKIITSDFSIPEAGALVYNYEYIDSVTLQSLFRSPEYYLSPVSTDITAKIKGGTVNIFINGRRLTGSKASLTNGINTIAIEYDGDIYGEFHAGNYSFPLDKSWKYSDKKFPNWYNTNFDDSHWQEAPFKGKILRKKGMLRKTVLCNDSLIWPDWKKDGVTLTRGGVQTLIFQPRGVKGKILNDYTLNVEIPEDFEIKGVSSYYNKYKIRMTTPIVFTKQKRKYKRYSVIFDQPLKFNELLPIYKQIIFLLKAPEKEKNSQNQLYFHAGSPSCAIVEIPQKIKINLLPELNGIRPEKIIIQMWPGWLHSLSSKKLQGYIVEDLIKAGVTETHIPSTEINQFICFDFESWNFGCAQFLKKNPEYALIDSQNKASNKYICSTCLLKKQAVKDFFTQNIPLWLRKRGPAKHVCWDFEGRVFHSYLACYCPRCISEFKRQFGLKAPLTPQIIEKHYPIQWTKYMNKKMADFAGQLNNYIKKYNPKIVFSVYSGYQSDYTKSYYGVDWAMLKGKIDVAMCGYGRPLREIQNTIKAVEPTPLATGLIVSPYEVNQRDYPTHFNQANLMRMFCDSTGGLLLYNMNNLDGKTFSALGSLTNLIAKYEDFFINGEKTKPPEIQGIYEDDSAMFKIKNRYLLILMNESSNIKKYKLDNSDFPDLKNIFDISGKTECKNIKGILPPGKFKAYIIN